MKVVLSFGFLAFALVQCYQDVDTSAAKRSVSPLPCSGTGADNKALKNFMEDGKPIRGKLTVTLGCGTDMVTGRRGDPTTGELYDFNSNSCCYVVGKSDLTVTLMSRTEPVIPDSDVNCKTSLGYQAVYLRQLPDAITYMILKPAVAPRFFTTTLSGCDIFVATSRGNGHNPIVIHSNLDSCGNKLQNLKKKGNLVDQMMKTHPGYKLIARVYSEPGKDEQRQANEYLKNYQARHSGIALVSYDTSSQTWQFMGHFDKKWKFFVKGEIDGRVKDVIIM